MSTGRQQPSWDRHAMLAKVHLARKELGLAEDDYRAILRRVTRHDSAAGCGPSQLDELLREFRRLGWKGSHRPRSPKPIIRMIHAVWRDIAPRLADGSDAALRSFVQRQTRNSSRPDGVTAPEFLDVPAATKVLEGLKAWRARLDREQRSLSSTDDQQ